jgi:pantothenate kinase/sugar/nucleoside kinase (ribokinase family)
VSSLASHGIGTAHVRVAPAGVPTSSTSVFTDARDGSRTFFHTPGGNGVLERADVSAAIRDVFAQDSGDALFFYLAYPDINARLSEEEDAGPASQHHRTAFAALLDEARAAGARCIVDVTAPSTTREARFLAMMPAILARTDLFFCNLEEARMIVHQGRLDVNASAPATAAAPNDADPSDDAAEAESLAQRLLAMQNHGRSSGPTSPAPIAVVHFDTGAVAVECVNSTSGGGGCEHAVHASFFARSRAVPAGSVAGTNGAGDAFSAAFMHSLWLGGPKSSGIHDALDAGCAAAAQCITDATPSGGLGTLAQAQAFAATLPRVEWGPRSTLAARRAALALAFGARANNNSAEHRRDAFRAACREGQWRSHPSFDDDIIARGLAVFDAVRAVLPVKFAVHGIDGGTASKAVDLPDTTLWLEIVPLLLTAADTRANRRGPALIAIAGPSGTGKSHLAAIVSRAAEASGLFRCAVAVPMDGYHRTNADLESAAAPDVPHDADPRGLRYFKGRPGTFDAAGLLADLRLALGEGPTTTFRAYDRDLHDPVANGPTVDAACDLIVLEGLFVALWDVEDRGDGDDPRLGDLSLWREIAALADVRVVLEAGRALSKSRTVQRAVQHGRNPSVVAERYERVDGANLDLILACSDPKALRIPASTTTVLTLSSIEI